MKKMWVVFLILLFPFCTRAVTLEEYNNAVASIAYNTISSYDDEFVYSFYWGNDGIKMDGETERWFNNAKNGIKSSGKIYGSTLADAGVHGSFKDKFAVYCDTFVRLMVHYASGGVIQHSRDYVKIKTEDIKRGDLIHFHNHIAVYLGDGGTGKGYYVAEASGKLKLSERMDESDYAYRVKEELLNKVDYNILTASYDFHDRLDDYPPVIANVVTITGTNKISFLATDNKHYDLSPPDDTKEPENFGIEYYQITNSSNAPVNNWIKINRVATLNMEVELNNNGIYYLWVKDVGGNVTSKRLDISDLTFDTIGPNIGTIDTQIDNHSITLNINGASDSSGIKEYHFLLNGIVVETSNLSVYKYSNLTSGKTYEISYEVVDTLGNVSKSEVFNLKVDNDIESIKLDFVQKTLMVGDSFKLNPIIEKKYDDEIFINYTSSNPYVATINDSGVINAIGVGESIINLFVGDLSFSLKLIVCSEKLEILTDNLDVGYINKDYEVIIQTNYNDSVISLDSGNLPNGLLINNNMILGVPTEEGTFSFTIKAVYNDLEVMKDYTLVIDKKLNIEIILIIVLIIIVIFIIIKIIISMIKKKV